MDPRLFLLLGGEPTPPIEAVGTLRADGKIFRLGDQPWRWRGVTAFALLNRFARGGDIDPFLAAFAGFNLLRVFLWVPRADWGDRAWDAPPPEAARRFAAYVGVRGFQVELTLLTGTLPLAEAQALVDRWFADLAPCPNVLIELVNEPHVYHKPDTAQLVVPPTARLWTSGDYDPSAKARGSYLVAHTARDADWPRRAHDLLEYYTGGGPGSPADPAHHVPCVADEPIRPDQVSGPSTARIADFRAYFGTCALLGAGATAHFESGKYGLPPTADEAALVSAARCALSAFPADAPLGPYRRIDESGRTLRTYVVGNYMVRIRPTTSEAPEPGWTALDDLWTLWRR